MDSSASGPGESRPLSNCFQGSVTRLSIRARLKGATEQMRKAILIVLAVFLASASYAFAQRLTGGLTVQVTDPEGKSVSDVKATVLSKARGNKVDLVSTSEGWSFLIFRQATIRSRFSGMDFAPLTRISQ